MDLSKVFVIISWLWEFSSRHITWIFDWLIASHSESNIVLMIATMC